MLLNSNYLSSISRGGDAPVSLRAPRHLGTRLAITAATLFVAVGCAADENNVIAVSLNSDFQLRVGESALVSEAKLKLGFIGVTSDSRCGKGEVCFREGDGVVRIWLQQDDQDKIERELHTASNESDITNYVGFQIRLIALNPARVSGVIIPPDDYIAILRVTGGDSGE